MRIAIIGSGNLGRALGAAWRQKGHDVRFGVRDPQSSNAQAARSATGDGAVASIADAASGADVVALATPFAGARDALRSCGQLGGTVVIDCTNPLTDDYSALVVGFTTSGGEQVAQWAPAARVVKAFNSLGAQHVGAPRQGREPDTMFFCGDDADAKRIVSTLGGELGFDMVDAGPLQRARLLEPLALLWISLAYAQGYGPGVAWRLTRS